MANVITHVYIAKRALELLPMNVREEIEPYIDAFLFGSVGPDFLFVLRELGDKAAKFPNAMQFVKQFEVFNALSEYFIQSKSTDGKERDIYEKAYVFGLLCHYVADLKYHPYVNYFNEVGIAKYLPADQVNGIHTMIESAIDTYVITEMMKHKGANDYNAVDKDLKPTKRAISAICNVYTQVVSPVIGIPLNTKQVKKAIKGTRFSMNFFTDKSGFKRKLSSKLEAGNLAGKKTVRNMMRPCEFYEEIDWMNFKHAPFRIIRNQDEMSNVSAIELMEETFHLCVQYILKFIDSIDNGKKLDKQDFRINYEGVDCLKKR